jgi:25S rRNA (uracil2634-N3)-methyltransferase
MLVSFHSAFNQLIHIDGVLSLCMYVLAYSGKGITDQDRNILSNQLLILGFLRSVATFLKLGPVPIIHAKRKRKRTAENDTEEDESEVNDEEDPSLDGSSMELEDELDEEVKPRTGLNTGECRGSVLITLRNVSPYTEWSVHSHCLPLVLS